jgi:tetratricopeptide (TPR) repeat protein
MRGAFVLIAWLGMLLVVGTSGCALGPTGGLLDPGSGARSRRVPPMRVVRAERSADYDVLVAEMASAEGDFGHARSAYLRAAEKDPDSAFIHAQLARLAWQMEDVEGAVREAEQAFGLDPADVETRLFLGRLYRLTRNHEGLDRVLRDDAGQPLDADAAYTLLQVALEQRDDVEAEQLAIHLIQLEPDQLRGPLGLATVYEQRGDLTAAEAVVRESLTTFPDHFLLYMRLAQIERARGDRAAEIALYREVLGAHPDHYGILQRLGQTQLEAGDIDGAIETYSHLVALYPDDVGSLRRLASIEFSAGRYESAENRLSAVLERDPDQTDLLFALGQIRRALGDLPGALGAFERIPPVDASYVDARLQIAALYEAEADYEAALAEIERVRVLRPQRELDIHAAVLQIELGDFESGVDLLESLLEGDEDDFDVLYQLGIQYGTHGHVDEGLRYMQRVLEIDPDNANALNYIGYAWAERGENLEEAEALIRRALEVAPGDGYITDSLGWVYYKMAEDLLMASRREEALKLLERAEQQLLEAAALTGGDPVVSEHLGDVLLLKGDRRGALDYYEQAVGLEMREDEQPDLLEKLRLLRRDLGVVNGAATEQGGAP